jgi:predicted porin
MQQKSNDNARSYPRSRPMPRNVSARALVLGVAALLGVTHGVAAAADAPPVAPGTVAVRLNGRFRLFAFAASDGDANNNAAGTPSGNVNAAGNGTATGRSKLASYGIGEFARLYPGFDGVAANGLKYGASIEIRQDNVSGAGGGAFGSITAQDRARGALYIRREWGYVGSEKFGTLRFGSTDQPSSLYLTGNFENFNDGGIDGDAPALLSPTVLVTWPFEDVGSYYTTNKLIYLSPQLFGFDGGISFEPSTANVSINSNCGAGSPVGANFVNAAGAFTTATGASATGAASAGCDRLSASPNNAESGRRRNTVDALVRYRGSFGPIGVAATAAGIVGGHVRDNQTGVPFNSNPLLGTIRNDFEGLRVADFGVVLTYGGLSVGGKYMTGRFNNGGLGLVPKGLAGGDAALLGTSYTAGPLIVGAHALYYKSAGDLGNAANGRQRTELGVAAGGTYSLAPGLVVYLSWVYSQRKQNGFNFVTGQGVTAASPGGNAFSNKVQAQFIALGTGFSW